MIRQNLHYKLTNILVANWQHNPLFLLLLVPANDAATRHYCSILALRMLLLRMLRSATQAHGTLTLTLTLTETNIINRRMN